MKAMRLIAALVLLAATDPAPSATVRRMPFETLVDRSDLVVYGRAVTRRSFLDPATRTIWTETVVRVLDGAKGRPGASIRVTEPGGVVGTVGHLFPGVPQLEVDREAVLFLYRDAAERLRLLGLEQGVYAVFRDAATGERRLRSAEPAEETLFADREVTAPRAAAPAPGPAVGERLADFLARVRARGAGR